MQLQSYSNQSFTDLCCSEWNCNR